MQVQRVSNQNNYSTNFGIKYKLSEQTIKTIEENTKLTYEEMKNLTLTECEKLINERRACKKLSKIRTWISEIYKKLCEKFGSIA